MEITGEATDATKGSPTGVLTGEAQDILNEATKGIPMEIWKAIALAEQAEAPVVAPSYIYTSAGTMGMCNAFPR